MKMVNSKILCLPLLMLLFSMGCKKEAFVNANLSPTTLYNVNPEDQFLKASIALPNDFEYFYDVYRSLNFWMQYTTNSSGNTLNFTNVSSNFNYRYGNFYGNVGPAIQDVGQIINSLPDEDKAARVYEGAIASIYKAYYAFYVSDINGNIPYTQAFQARYSGQLTPVYDEQQALFDTLDVQVKNAVKTLSTAQSVNQLQFGTNDPFFGSSATQEMQWIKAGNALRLKMAMRLMKRDPNKLKAVAAEVLADPNVMSAIEDSWMLTAGPSFADGAGNYNPGGFVAGRPVLEFMKSKSDPRLRVFYRPNKNGQYVGAFPSPDESRLPANLPLYKTADTLSQLQHRLFTPNYDEGDGNGVGSGTAFFPVITYAEFCFMRADLAARGITSENAGDWYNKGVTASIKFYDKRATAAKISNYQNITDNEIATYLAAPGVAFDGTKAADQIGCQAFLDFFRQPTEAWAWWKRTGYPNTTSVLAWSELKSNGSTLQLPRRAGFTAPATSDPNYNNKVAAYTQMSTDPNFGSGLGDVYGRIWWDTK